MFSDGKAPDALRTIGEVSAGLGIKPHVLRYWEEQFPTLRPLKRGGSRRYYRPEDIAIVQRIDQLVHRDGYTLKGAKAVLAGKGEVMVPVTQQTQPVSLQLVAPVQATILAELVAIRNTLVTAL